MVESILALHNVHHQLGEAHVVLCKQRVDGNGLDNIVHEEEPLRVLKAALRQVSPWTILL